MKILRFEGRSAAEALAKAQAELGPDAVVLHTRQSVDAAGAPCVEVTAAVDNAPGAAPVAPSAPPPSPAASQAPFVYPTLNMVQQAPFTPPPVPPASGLSVGELEAMRRELAELRNRVTGLTSGQASSLFNTAPAPAPGYRDAGFMTPGEIARRLETNLRTRSIEMRPGRCTAVALVGPTGVGKTTTLAKLAAVASRWERKRVAIINLDTYRIGAVEQLEAYARLLETPLTVCYSADDVRAARDKYAAFDLVLIDTTGRSPGNTEELRNLASLLEAARPDEVHLFLEARDSVATHSRVLNAFQMLRPTHLLLSKLDEAAQFGEALMPALECGLPFSYLTTGQRVPEDLAPASASTLVSYLSGSNR